MALFFDAAWFDARLAERGLRRDALAAAARLSLDTLADIFKDQREVTPDEVAAFAALLGATAQETALRCGVSTRAAGEDRISALEARVARLEALVARLTSRD